MKNLAFVAVFVLLIASGLSGQTTAFIGVNVIPMDRERILANQTVIVRNGVVAEIGDASRLRCQKTLSLSTGKASI